ncbi:MAG TPA: Tad domain-containing protein [Lacipirellulaceae bacterium]|jgi:hypothetical protein|nr:Tad domain-containing protein [Lacipirellulaceae bacterium]
MESSNNFKTSQRFQRSYRGTARSGKISIVTIFAILGLIVMAGFIGNAGQVVTTKVSAQNAADAVAFSSAQWMARGMNAATATNHLIGEVTGLCVVIEALGGPELDAGMSQYTPQNKTLDGVMDALYKLAPAPAVSPYPTEILNAFEEPLIDALHSVMVPDDEDAKKSRVWATVYDAKLQLKVDVDTWLGVEALSNLLFLIPPPFGYPTAAVAFGAHIVADVAIVEDGKEWFMLTAVEIVLESQIATEFKTVLEETLIPALVANGDFIAGQKGSKSGGAPPAGGIVSAAVNDAVTHLGKTYALQAFLFPEAARFSMPIEREPGPSLREGTPQGQDEPEWGKDTPLTLPDASGQLSNIKDNVDGGRKKIVARIAHLNQSIATLDGLEADINKLEGQDGVTADERKDFDAEKAKIDKDKKDDNDEITELNGKLADMDNKQKSTDKAMSSLGQLGSESGNLSAKRAHLALNPGQMKESEERYTQWARATYPYVDSFRAPILAIFADQLTRSGAADHYEKWTNRYTLTKTFQFRSGMHFHGSGTEGSWQQAGDKLAMYVMRDAYAKSGARHDQKGREPWTLSTNAGKQQAEKLFTVIGLTHRDLKPLFSPVIYPSGDKHGATTFAQAVFYNANDQKPDAVNAKSPTQAKVGWDTLNWDPSGSAPEWGHRQAVAAEDWPWNVLTSSSSRSSSAKVKLNWQAKLMPVTKTRLQGAVTMPMSADMNANVAEAFKLFDRMVTH